MKKTLRAVGAAGLAAATAVTGLSFGPAARAIDTPADSPHARLVGKFVTQSNSAGDAWAFAAVPEAHLGAELQTGDHRTLASAEAVAATWSFPALQDTGPVQNGGLCLNFTAVDEPLTAEECDDSPAQQFIWSDEADPHTVKDEPALTPASDTTAGIGITAGPSVIAQTRIASDGYPLINSYREELSAAASNVDVEAGTALLSGVAPSDATDVDVTWAAANGSQKKRNVDVVDGRFTQQLTELALGTTTAHLKAWNDGEVIAEADVEVKLELAPVTAKAEFSSDAMETVQLYGTAQPNAPIEFRHGEKVVGGATANASGDWTGTVNAPNTPGKYTIDVVQKVRGEDAGRAPLDIDYGAGVTVTTPADGAEVDPAEPRLIIRGTAPSGTTVRIYEKGHAAEQLGEPVIAGSNGTYRLQTVPLEDREYKLVLGGITKGYNRTTDEITVNPGKSSELTPATVSTKSFTPGKTNTFEGTATKGATLKVVNKWGTDLLGKDVPVDGDGNWSFERVLSNSASKFEFKLVQTKGSLTTTSELFTITAEDPAAGLVDPTVTAPTEVDLGVNNTFTGKATANATMKIVNASGTDLLGHSVTVNGSGDWTFDRVVSWNAKNFTFFIEQTKNGATKKTGPYVINPAID